MKKLIIELSDERLITPSGLSLVGQLLGKSRFIKKCNTMKVDSKRSQSQIKNGDILLSYIGLLCQGKTAYEDIREMSADLDYYELALGITRSIPSAETLRRRMDDIGSSLRKNILDANVEMFHTYNIEPTPISEEFVPVDLNTFFSIKLRAEPHKIIFTFLSFQEVSIYFCKTDKSASSFSAQ